MLTSITKNDEVVALFKYNEFGKLIEEKYPTYGKIYEHTNVATIEYQYDPETESKIIAKISDYLNMNPYSITTEEINNQGTKYNVVTKIEYEGKSIEFEYGYFYNNNPYITHIKSDANEIYLGYLNDKVVLKIENGISNYNPHTIIVFLIHKWDLDKFRPTYSNWDMCISDNNEYELSNAVKSVQQFINNPLDSYYRTLDVNYEGNNKHNNKYTAYIDGMWKNEICPVIHKYVRRFGGWIGTTAIKTMTMLDRRVHSMETKYHSDKWNAEFESALLFYYGDTPWKSWKRYNDYDHIAIFFRMLCDYNIFINMTYVDKARAISRKFR